MLICSYSYVRLIALENTDAILYNKNMAKTLIFGGAFDPPHTQHVEMCRAAMRQLGISRLVVVPTFQPPHKGAGYLDYETRVRLVKKAFESLDPIVDDIEQQRGGENYSCLVLPILKRKYGDIVYLIGGDSLMYLDKWYRPNDVTSVCPIAVAARRGYGDIADKIKALEQSIGGNYIPIDFVGEEVSSSVLRAQLLLGEMPEAVDRGVYDIIQRKGLFCEEAATLEKLRGFETDELFAHSKAVVLRAIDFNSKHHLGQDFEKVFTAALLHDNAKQRPSTDGLFVPQDAIGTPVLHQFLGAEKAARDFGVTDGEILDAIRYHTTARANMTMLEKLIYTADSLSDDRTYDPIPDLRQIAIDDFDSGFKATLAYTYEKLRDRGRPIYPLTVEAYDFYIGNKKLSDAR